MTDMNSEYETIAKARTYLGTIISAPKGRFVEMDLMLLHQAHDELLRAIRAMDKKPSVPRAG
jgi:hypothetical protein